jgi:hypothetical protein
MLPVLASRILQMSFRVTANALFVSALLAGLVEVAPCQSDLPASTPVVGCLSERSSKLILTDKDGDTYLLEGHTAELYAHVGDELSVSGRIRAAGRESGDENPFGVVSFSTVLRKNPAGVQPRLGDPRNWSTFTDKSLGVVVRHPKTFLQQDMEPGGVRSNFVDPTGILTLHAWSIPREVYRGSNFVGGTFEVAVEPTIRSEGTCRQFGSTAPGYTFSKTLGGIRYAQTQIGGVAMGTANIVYHLHTFQNGFCYEFTFEFDEADGTGMELFFCTIQWLSKDNEQKLLDSLLSQVSFVAPEIRNAPKGIPARRPLVTSLEQSQQSETQTAVSWSTEGADYVQLQFPCIDEQVVVSDSASGSMKCDGPTDRNFPPNGSETLFLINLNLRSVRLVLTVEPFSDGVESHKGRKPSA